MLEVWTPSLTVNLPLRLLAAPVKLTWGRAFLGRPEGNVLQIDTSSPGTNVASRSPVDLPRAPTRSRTFFHKSEAPASRFVSTRRSQFHGEGLQPAAHNHRAKRMETAQCRVDWHSAGGKVAGHTSLC